MESVTKSESGTWDFQCPGVEGQVCGAPDGANFVSTGWPTRKSAEARGRQHLAEHAGESPMQPLDEFRAEQGVSA